ncbi:MAG TPA: glycogen debranching N-terminal domain-containing protein, partial [Terriglobales bacterium]|nr:glycogen debranching N-terminal domain-containing protein [Terriglobales bacterium]
MSTRVSIPQAELVEVPSPYVEPRVAFQTLEPRKVNNLTLIEGKTFLSTTVAGDITPAGAPDVGFFHDDTRFLSYLELKVGGHRAVVLSSSTENTFVSQIELTTGNITLRDSFDLPENTIHIRREQLLGEDTFFDRFTFENFNLAPVDIFIELSFEADFVDVFQVRGCPRSEHGQYYRPVVEQDRLSFYYRGRDGILRQTLIAMRPAPAHLGERSARWEMKLPPLKQFQMEVTVTPGVEGQQPSPRSYDFGSNLRRRRENYAEWESISSIFSSSHGVFDAALQTAIGDFHALQIPDGNQCTIGAGIPWFATIFGRDSIIASYQALALNPQLAIDTLRVLARYQGTEYNDWRDEEPGKILHELRTGEMTRSGEMPFGPYYGSVDATPLFLI